MKVSFKSKIPLLFLLSISTWWAFYYQTSTPLNDYGQANFEWLYLLDGLILLPVLCFICIQDKKQAALKALVFCCLAVLIGSYIIPEQSKFIWHYLESGRYFVLAALLLFEITAVLTVCLAIKSALNTGDDPDLAISKPITKMLGEGVVTNILLFEARVWTYALFAKAVNTSRFSGEQHFSYHNKDGAGTNAIGFIFLIVFEVPLVHLLLHFLWSPMAANVVSLLTLVSLVFFIAEYRAMSRRPISLDKQKLSIRYGVYTRAT